MTGGSILNSIFALRPLIECYRHGQLNLHGVFIKLQKIYERVPKEEVWNCMRLKGTPELFVQLVRDKYKVSTTYVKYANDCSEAFGVAVGLHQRSVLKPHLFAMMMDYWTENIRRKVPWEITCVGNFVPCNKTRQGAEERQKVWRKVLEKRGMGISRKKTEYLCAGGGDAQEKSIKLENDEIPKVT